MNLAVITSGFLPVPATKGGAVENLIVNLINENETNKKIKFSIFSIYDKDAKEKSNKYNYTEFKFIKVNGFVKFMDKLMFFVAKNILKKENSHSYRFIFQRLAFLNKVSKILKRENFDKVLLENHPTQYLALKWRKNYIKYNGRYYYHCHNEFPGTYGCDEIIRKTKLFICVSQYRANNVKNYLGIEEEKFVVLKNGIDKNLFEKEYSAKDYDNLKRNYGINDDEKILLFVGRIVPGKGIKELIEALTMVKHQKYKLLVAGAALNSLNIKTRYEEEISDAVSKVKDKVIFTGFIDYKKLGIIYRMADIAIIPSIMEDSAPLTIIESISSELPIITTDSGGIPEYVNKKCAVIINRDENIVENLAISIDKLVNNEILIENMKNECMKLKLNYTTDRFFENFVNIIVD